MMSKGQRARSMVWDDMGQSLIEVALALPLLLLIVLGLVDLGRTYAYKISVTNAAREAAIYAARQPGATADAICLRAVMELSSAGSPGTCTLLPVDPTRPTIEIWSSSSLPVTVVCTRGVNAVPCGSDKTFPRLYQTDGAAGADVSVTVSYRVSLLTGYLVTMALNGNPVAVGASAVFGTLGE